MNRPVQRALIRLLADRVRQRRWTHARVELLQHRGCVVGGANSPTTGAIAVVIKSVLAATSSARADEARRPRADRAHGRCLQPWNTPRFMHRALEHDIVCAGSVRLLDVQAAGARYLAGPGMTTLRAA